MVAIKENPVVDDQVLFDGEMHRLVDTKKRWSEARDEPVTLVIIENTRTKVTCLQEDLRWEADWNCWYLWGRALRKSDRAIVAELRDRGLLPARRSRAPGNAPAGGEHKNLYAALFRGRPAGFWSAALAQVRPGGNLPAEAVAAIADYEVLFRQKLTEGYAVVDADESSEGASA